MSQRVALTHRSSYHYDRKVQLGPQVIRLRPAPHCRTKIESYSLRVTPDDALVHEHQDPHGNFLARAVFPSGTRRFTVEVDLLAELSPINPFDFFLEPGADTAPFAYDPLIAEEIAPFRKTAKPGPRLRRWLAGVNAAPRPTVDLLVALNQRLQAKIAYTTRLEAGVRGPEETLALAEGSCRDTAWLFVQILRHLGFAARFTSGYLIQLAPDQRPLDGPPGPERDGAELHAWAEVYLPGAGWVGLDATSGLFAAEGHIPLAATPEPASAAPITGTVSESRATFKSAMTVARIAGEPRVGKPYDAASWRRIDKLGQAVDTALEEGDVRLTMGGEPTFVSDEDRESSEWHVAALSPKKKELAWSLLARLSRHFAKSPLLHDGQGKWYPGEPLPRWALTCLWRRDGRPVWRDPALLRRDRADDADLTAAAAFAGALAARLKLKPEAVIAAYEDPWPKLHRSLQRPPKSEAEEGTDDTFDPDRLTQADAPPVGYLLPLVAKKAGSGKSATRWRSGRWPLRRSALFLTPGDSPLGFRLPLASLPDRPRLVRTALCLEPRDGRLHVFMPPLDEAKAYLDLLRAVEATAAKLGRRLVIEGYLPPADPALNHFTVTPDPGVIEVNIHPAESWPALVEQATTIYEAARHCRLSAEKFQHNGRPLGTGGGSHIVLGGARPADSPFLRRPDLLRSMLAFWINHPSLSYLFAGLFIGPTSQHPRIDEARGDALNELEVAFDQIDGENAPVDAILRHMLVDLTGNTHRAEFCIDKLYAAQPGAERPGLLELRGFEMQPHPRMQLVLQLLIRALVAAFWRRPYEQPLVRWGTRLHDAFLLPHFLWQDFLGVLAALAEAGFRFEEAWFAPHLAFRCPLLGRLALDGVTLELRQALEPWPVLAEHSVTGGTARMVDSSLERVELKAVGLTAERHLIACNGRALPLRASATPGEYVAGVKFPAWQMPDGLHPTVRPQVPLVFELYDRWSGRALGGFSYHVARPDGALYNGYPVNAGEAEARLRPRFLPGGHRPGPMPEPAPLPQGDLPVTLDLRRK
ncbi:MAG: transglutaminase family protein [Kiloniellales bacterium]|nr:transglutaminase family protein [Kiloniellales bacterium]